MNELHDYYIRLVVVQIIVEPIDERRSIELQFLKNLPRFS